MVVRNNEKIKTINGKRYYTRLSGNDSWQYMNKRNTYQFTLVRGNGDLASGNERHVGKKHTFFRTDIRNIIRGNVHAIYVKVLALGHDKLPLRSNNLYYRLTLIISRRVFFYRKSNFNGAASRHVCKTFFFFLHNYIADFKTNSASQTVWAAAMLPGGAVNYLFR